MENKTYSFEYTEKVWRIYWIPLPIFFVSLLLIPFLRGAGIIPTLLLSLGIPFLIAYLFGRTVKKIGTATIMAQTLLFDLENRIIEIPFHEIVSYRIRSYQDTYKGTFLKIKLVGKKHFSIGAHSYHSKPFDFDVFCAAFDETIENRNGIRDPRFKIVREKNYFEKKWPLRITFYSLSILTVMNFICSFTIYKTGIIQVTFGLLFARWMGLMTAYMVKDKSEIRTENERRKKTKINQNSSSLTNSNSSLAES
jgi:hypothetical protein